MSDMSFKQAKELTEQLELAEITLATTLKKLEISSKDFNNCLLKQKDIIHYIPITDKKVNKLKIIIAVNIGFIIGVFVTKYLF
jgi:hypothetical protein